MTEDGHPRDCSCEPLHTHEPTRSMSKTTSNDGVLATLVEAPTSRRNFLRSASLTAVGGALVACGTGSAATAKQAAAVAQAGTPKPGATGGTMGPHDTAVGSGLSASDQMDAMHKKGIKAFPAKTAVHGNQLLKPKLENGVKVFELTAAEMQWETAPEPMVSAVAHNRQVPGPQIRVTEGDLVKSTLKNPLQQSTATHFP